MKPRNKSWHHFIGRSSSLREDGGDGMVNDDSLFESLDKEVASLSSFDQELTQRGQRVNGNSSVLSIS